MKFLCNYCPTELPHFKALLDHCEERHPHILTRFQIRNKKLKQTLSAKGESAVQLCNVNKWDIKDCKIEPIASGQSMACGLQCTKLD